MPDISSHPSFKDLFTSEWALALKARLSDFLSITPSFASEPRLLAICRNYRELGAGAGAGSAHPVAEARKDLQALKQRLLDSELRAVEAKQAAASREAAMARGGSEAIGVALDAMATLSQQLSLDPATLGGLQRRVAAAQQRLGFEPTSFAPARAAAPPADGGGGYGGGGGGGGGAAQDDGMGAAPLNDRQSLGQAVPMLAALDYAAIKQTMFEAAADAPLLMQALRWRLTKTPRRQRRTALIQYVQNDLLSQEVTMAALADSSPPAAREQALRLINLFASEPSGRSYLLAQPALIPRLCDLLMSEAMDTVARQNALGSLQKLSLRRQPQNAMIDADVIAWLVKVLSDADSLSQYSIEYGTALLMNLSLRTAGKAKCTERSLDILTALSQLMESDSMQVRTYVNGTLYSVLTRPSLKERAHEIGLPDSLKLLIEHSDETFARQINYILEQLESDADAQEDEGADSGDEAGDEEEEEPEADDEADDDEEEEVDVFPEATLPTDVAGGVSGEELLVSRYIGGMGEAMREAELVRDSLEAEEARRRAQAEAAAAPTPAGGTVGEMATRRRHHPDEPLQRPTTPRASGKEGAAAEYAAGIEGMEGMEPPTPARVDESSELPPPDDLDGSAGPRSLKKDASKKSLAALNYPDPSSVDETLAYVPVSNRLPRTPAQKTRPGNAADSRTTPAPLQPTASRPRAPVERLQRRPPQAQGTPAPGSVAKPKAPPKTEGAA